MASIPWIPSGRPVYDMSADGDSTGDSDENVVDECSVQEPTKNFSGLVHKIEWIDDESRTRKMFQSEVPFGPLKIDTAHVDIQKSDELPLEVVTPVRGSAAPDMPAAPSGPTGIKDVKIRHIGRTKMIIRSQSLLEIIRGCVEYFPAETLSGDVIELYTPYCMLIHHLDRLEEAGKGQDLEYYTVPQCC